MISSGLNHAFKSAAAIVAAFCACLPAFAQLNQNCAVSVLNRTVSVNPDGSWVLPNIPANFGQVKARATCTQNSVTTFGESDWFTVPANGAVNLPAITMGNVTPIPTSLSIAAVANLTSAGQTAQLAVTATYPDGSTKDVTPSASGTNYTISNPAIATITVDGLVTAVSSGTVVIQANNDGATGISTAMVMLGGQQVGGIPVDWLLKYHLNPNDPLVAMEDPDRDGLTNLQEYQLGTDPTNPDTDSDGLTDGAEVNIYHTNPLIADTDGDKIPDGVEVQTGTDPNNPHSYDLAKATAVSVVTPPSFTLSTSIANPQLSVQLDWKVTLIDGKTTLDLTADPRTEYGSTNLGVCSFGQQPGLVFSGGSGACTITISQNTLSAAVTGAINSFTPKEVAVLPIAGAVAVDVGGTFAYVATGTNGLVVVDVNNRSNPFTRGTLRGLGDAEGIRAAGQYVYIADATGFLRIVNVQNPDAPSLTSSLAVTGKPISLAVHGTMATIAAQGGGVALVNINDPTNPVLIGTASVPASAIGADFDPTTDILAVAMGTSGLQLVDISSPATPKLRGFLPGGDVRRVLLKSPAALLADAQRSVTAVNVSNPDQPTIASSMASNLGGVPVDIAAYGNIAMTADITFGKASPIINISIPLQPISDGFWTWQSYPGFGSSIAVDLSYGYMILQSSSVLRILQYQNIVDPFGISPTASITFPTPRTTLIQGETITTSVNATDDVAVASVSFLVEGENLFTTSASPYQFQYIVPAMATMLVFGATAVDFGNNVGAAQNVMVDVIPDPLTTVTGHVIDGNGNPVSGATVSIPAFASSPTSTTGADGSFSIAGISTVHGNFQVLASIVVSGATLAGFSASVGPVRGGTTDAGTITVLPIPIITAMSAKSMLEATQIIVTVTGSTFQGASWSFQPASSPPVSVQAQSTSQDGTSATLMITAPNGIVGTFALVASNAAGNSGTTANRVNRLTFVDPNSTADTDGDGFQDVIEAVYGTDPLDPTSYPSIRTSTEAESIAFSVLNAPVSGALTEAESVPFSVLNAPFSGAATEAEGVPFSVLNAPVSSAAVEVESVPFSVLNAPISAAGVQEAESVPFSVLNAPIGVGGITEADGYFSVCNQFHYSNCPTMSAAQPQTTKPSNSSSGAGTDQATLLEPSVTVDPLADSDGDGLPDWFELLIGTNPRSADTDGDGVSDYDEIFVHHTNPLASDTDGDGFSDGDEVLFGSDPLNSADTPLTRRNPAIAKNSKQVKAIKGEKSDVSQKVSRTKAVSGALGGTLDLRRSNEHN